MFRIGLRQCHGSLAFRIPSQTTPLNLSALRSISSLSKANHGVLAHSKPSATSTTPHSYLSKLKPRHQSTLRQTSGQKALNWNAFFRLRKSRRRWTFLASIISFGGAGVGTLYYMAMNPEQVEKLTSFIPLDPLFAMGAPLVVAVVLGWLVGPIFATTLWNTFHRSQLREFQSKEKLFFQRIKAHRVNPMGANSTNPVPDYYGEKISSVSGYRQWLKDQRVFNKKREGTYTGPPGVTPLGLGGRS